MMIADGIIIFIINLNYLTTCRVNPAVYSMNATFPVRRDFFHSSDFSLSAPLFLLCAIGIVLFNLLLTPLLSLSALTHLWRYHYYLL